MHIFVVLIHKKYHNTCLYLQVDGFTSLCAPSVLNNRKKRQLAAAFHRYYPQGGGRRSERSCAIFSLTYVNNVVPPLLELHWTRLTVLPSDWLLPASLDVPAALPGCGSKAASLRFGLSPMPSVAALNRPERLLSSHEAPSPVSENVCCVIPCFPAILKSL